MASTPPKSGGSPKEEAWRRWAEESITGLIQGEIVRDTRVRAVIQAATNVGNSAANAATAANTAIDSTSGVAPTNRIARPLNERAYWVEVTTGKRKVWTGDGVSSSATGATALVNGIMLSSTADMGAELDLTPLLQVPASGSIRVGAQPESGSVNALLQVTVRDAAGQPLDTVTQLGPIPGTGATVKLPTPETGVAYYTVKAYLPADSGSTVLLAAEVFEIIGSGTGMNIGPDGIYIEDDNGDKTFEFNPSAPNLPAPSTPTLTTGVGQVTVHWDGALSEGGALPARFSYVRAEEATSPTGMWVRVGQSLSKGGDIITRPQIGATMWYRLIAVDTMNRESAPSAVASIVVGGVVEADLDSTITDAIDQANTDASEAKTAAAAAQTVAGEAQTAADEAKTDAATAAGIANGKGKVLIQSTTPAAEDELPQNLWIDTTEGANTPKRWDGAGWVTVTDKAATDAAGAAAAAQLKADQAFAQANAAATAAGNAQTSADSKSRVWYQATAPAGTGHKVGDTWFNTSAGNKIHRWSGTAWEPVLAGADAIAAKAIDSTKIADAVNANIQKGIADAATAAGKADTAQATADGKNAVWYRTTAPAGTAHKVGDTWFDTDDGNRIHRWSGTAWDPVPVGAGALDTDVTTAIDDAQAEAEKALKNAADAQWTADGRNRIYTSATEPMPGRVNLFTNPSFEVGSGTVDVPWDAVPSLRTITRTDVAPAQGYISDTVIDVEPGQIIRACVDWDSSDPAGNAIFGLGAKKDGAWDGAGSGVTNWGGSSQQERWIGTSYSTSRDRRVKHFLVPEGVTQVQFSHYRNVGSGTYSYTLSVHVVDEVDFQVAYAGGRPELGVPRNGESTLTGVRVAGMVTNAAQTTDYQVTVPDGGKALRSVMVIDGAKGINLNGMASPQPSTQYTLLLRARASHEGVVTLRVAGANSSGHTLTTGWGDYRATVTTGSTVGNTGILIQAGSQYYPVGSWIEIATAALVEGVYDGPWFETFTKGDLWYVLNGEGRVVGVKIWNGTAWADQVLVADSVLVPGSAGTISLADGAITTPKIYAGAVTTAKLDAKAVTADKMAANSITAANAAIADAAITNAKIANLDAAKITSGYLAAERLQAGSIGANKLMVADTSNMATINESIAGGSAYGDWVSTIVDGWSARSAITNTYFMFRRQHGPLPFKTGDRIRVTFEAYADAAVTAQMTVWTYPGGAGAQSFSPAIPITTTPQTFDRELTVTFDTAGRSTFLVGLSGVANRDVRVRNVRAYRMNAGELIVDGAITADKVAANAITSAKLDAGAVTTAKLDAKAVTADKMAANSITAANAAIADLAVTNAKIANLDAAKITSGYLDVANRIKAGSISVKQLLVSNFSNLIDDPSFEAAAGVAWDIVRAGASISTAAARTGSSSLYAPGGVAVVARSVGAMQVEQGEEYHLSAWVRTAVGISALNGITLRMNYGATEAVGTVSPDIALTPNVTQTSFTYISGVWTVPAWTKFAKVEIVQRNTAATAYYVDDISVQKRASGELIVDGAIDGKVITGATVRTAASGQRVQLDVDGLKSYNSSNQVTGSLSAGAGGLTLSGTLRSGSGNQRAELHSTGIDFYTSTGLYAGGIAAANDGGSGSTAMIGINSVLIGSMHMAGGGTADISADGASFGVAEISELRSTEVNAVRTRLTSTSDASLSSTNHAFQIGPTNGTNLIMDNNEIMVRSNNVAAGLTINGEGGNVTLGNSSSTTAIPGRVNSTHLPWAMASGRGSITAAASAGTNVTVTLPSGRFSVAPNVVASLGPTTTYMGYRYPSIWSVSKTSFQFAVSNLAIAVTVPFTWIAIQMSSGSANG